MRGEIRIYSEYKAANGLDTEAIHPRVRVTRTRWSFRPALIANLNLLRHPLMSAPPPIARRVIIDFAGDSTTVPPPSNRSSPSSSSFFARWLTIEPLLARLVARYCVERSSIRFENKRGALPWKRVGSVYIRNGRILFWLTKDRRFALCAIFIFPRTYPTTNSFD